MTASRGLPKYKVVHLVVNPHSGFRVPVAAVVQTPDGRCESVIPAVPGPECIGSLDAYMHIMAFSAELRNLDRFDKLPVGLGPHFVLGDAQAIPTEHWRGWMNDVVFRRDQHEAKATKPKTPRLAGLGRKVFEKYNVGEFVRDKYTLDEHLRSGLTPVTHWADLGDVKLLMEPLSPRRQNPVDDMVKASQRLAAYRLRIDKHPEAGHHELLAYTLPGLDAAITHELREAMEGIGTVFDLENTREELQLIERVREAGRQQHLVR